MATVDRNFESGFTKECYNKWFTCNSSELSDTDSSMHAPIIRLFGT